jgi:hypothetical protein
MVYVGVTRVKVELLAAPLPDHPRSQKDLLEPSEALIYEAEFSLSAGRARGKALGV